MAKQFEDGGVLRLKVTQAHECGMCGGILPLGAPVFSIRPAWRPFFSGQHMSVCYNCARRIVSGLRRELKNYREECLV